MEQENNIIKNAIEKPNTSPREAEPDQMMTFDQLCDCMDNFFSTRDYESRQAYKQGYGSVVGEDYTNIDMLTNLCEIIYNYCTADDKLSKSERQNMKNITKGIQQIYRGMGQFDASVRMDNVLIAQLMGYILKITRNYFNDRRR